MGFEISIDFYFIGASFLVSNLLPVKN